MNKKIMITGAAGFIGKHLVRALRIRGFTGLTLVDPALKEQEGARTVMSSFGDLEKMQLILPGHDVLFHLGAVVGVHTTLSQEDVMRKVNNDETKAFFELAAQSKIQKIVFTSSSEIYGNSDYIPFSEESHPTPISDYGKYKVEIEQYLKALTNAYGVCATIVRLFNVYGIGQRSEFVINKFVDLAKKGDDLVVNWDGSQTRCFTYVDDVIGGLIAAMEYQETPYEIFNLGSQEETSVLDLAKKIINLTSSKDSDIVVQNLSKLDRYDIPRRVPDISKASAKLGFVSKVTLAEGLKKILNAA